MLLKVGTTLVKMTKMTDTHIKSTSIENRNGRKHSIYQIDINGKDRINKWIKHIGFNNKRHIIKYERWAGADLNRRSTACEAVVC